MLEGIEGKGPQWSPDMKPPDLASANWLGRADQFSGRIGNSQEPSYP